MPVNKDAAPPRHAATVVVVRDGTAGLEVLLLQRAEKGDHNSGAWVFPGGLVDAGDRACHAWCLHADDGQASAMLGVASGGLDHWVAAIRECFEEAGILLAVDGAGHPVSLDGERGEQIAALRWPLHRGDVALATLCREYGLRLANDHVFYIGHWVTPAGRAKRFDTRFFLAALPAGQRSRHDAVETTGEVWIAPAEALSAAHTRRLMTPTRAMLELLAAHADVVSLLAWARMPRRVERVLPRLALDATGARPILPGHPAWDEVGRLDPQGAGTAWCELRPGTAVQLSAHVWRATAADDPPRHAYLVSAGPGRPCALIDAEPAGSAAHAALLAVAPGPLRWLLRTGSPADEAGAEELALGDHTTLRRLPGPGGCQWWLTQEQTLFSGAAAPTRPDFAWCAARHGFLVRGPAAPEPA
jgi:8-oxo-dGTP pyrophosphatase MutT (NUDIX family)